MRVNIVLEVDMVEAGNPATIVSDATQAITEAFWRSPAVTMVSITQVQNEE